MRVMLFLCFIAFSMAGQTTDDPIRSASQMLRAGNYRGAHEALAAALTDNKNDPRLFTLDGFALARLGKDRDAIAAYESALALAPQYLPALEGAVELKFKSRSADAAQWIGRLLALQPADATAHAMSGTLAFERGDCATAESEFAQSEGAIARQTSSLESRGACLLRLKRPGEAVKIFTSLVEQQPRENRFRYKLAASQIAAGANTDAARTLESTVGKTTAEGLDLLADAYERSGDTPKAATTLRDALVLAPESTPLYLHFTDLCLAHHSFQAGVDMLNTGIARSPKVPALYLARGILRAQLAQHAAAEEDFAHAETLEPNTRYVAALQGMAKLQQNQLEPAASEIRSRVKRQPNDAFLQYLLAETLARRGAVPGTPDFTEAVKSAQKAVDIQPDFALARDVLGRLYLQEGKVTAAVEESRKAFASDPNDVTALYHLIRALRKAGKTDELPELTRKLTALRAQAQQKEIEERRYAIAVSAPH